MLNRNRRVSLPFRAIPILVALGGLLVPIVRAAGHGEPGPVFPVEIRLVDRQADLKLLTEIGIDIDGVFFDRARAYVIDEEVEKLTLLGFDLARIPDEAKEAVGPAFAAYHTYATLTSELQAIAADHPQIVRLTSAGKSVQARELWIVKITKNPDIEEDEPEFRYIAAMHGDEVVGKENCINLINLLTDSYGTDPRITELVDTTEIWILPSANPDGTELHQRYNVNGYDLNRSFPDRIQDPVDSTVGRQPEVAAMMNWGFAHSSVLSANFHGGTVVTNYPWDGNAEYRSVYTASPDDALFVSISRTYADNNPTMLASNSDPSYNNGICNGADWYVIYGGIQDWSYFWHGDNDTTIEISVNKWPAASTLPGFWNQNRESMLAYMERVHEGARGIVTDASTGAPLLATIRIEGIDHSVYTDPDRGDYHRMLLPGHYSMEISAAGYTSAIVPDFEVLQGGPPTRLDVQLFPARTDLQPVRSRALDGVGGNGMLDPGESADLAVTLRDLGLAATNITGSLEATGWYGEVTRADAAYPDLATGGSGESTAPHHAVRLDPSTPVGHKAGFAVRWTADQGSGTSEPFFLEVGPPACTTVNSTDVPLSILDRKTAASTLSFATDREISEVNVRVDLTHPYIGDLAVTVVSPDGIPVVLHDRSGGSSDNIVGWYDTEKTPAEPLSRLRGEHSAGTWTLRVNDGVPGNTGTLNGWSLEVCGRAFEASTPAMRIRDVWKEPGKVVVTWWPYPGLSSYRVYRATDPSSPAHFADVTSEDPSAFDTRFEDASSSPILYWLVTGVGPAGEGPR